MPTDASPSYNSTLFPLCCDDIVPQSSAAGGVGPPSATLNTASLRISRLSTVRDSSSHRPLYKILVFITTTVELQAKFGVLSTPLNWNGVTRNSQGRSLKRIGRGCGGLRLGLEQVMITKFNKYIDVDLNKCAANCSRKYRS